MAHVDNDSPYRVGKYGVIMEAIDKVVVETMSEDHKIDLFIIDEIGKMECISELFVHRMSALLGTKNVVIATIALQGTGFIAEVKNLPGVELWEVTVKNRHSMPDKIISWIRERIPRKS